MPTPNAKIARGAESTFIAALLVLRRGQPDSGKSCTMLESRPTCSLFAKFLQHSSLAVREFRAAGNERCKQDHRWME